MAARVAVSTDAWPGRGGPVAVPALGFLLLGATVAWGLGATAAGHDLGTQLPPLLLEWSPRVQATTPLLAAAVTVAAVAGVRLATAQISAARFAGAALALGLALRVALGLGRGDVNALWSVYNLGRPESSNEYLPALPAFDFGTRFFLDTFAQVGTSLPVHAVGHPPGLLVTLHLAGIDTAPAMAALTIGVGALAIPLTYLLARRLLEEQPARVATVLYVFAPSAVLYGATSADALFATVGTAALVGLVSAPAAARATGAAALALASFFSWANLALGALAALVVARRDGPLPALGLVAACALALVAFYGLLHLATGFDPVGAIRSAEIVYRAGVASGRPYGFWVVGSPAAFLIAAGLPLAWLAMRALARGQTVAVALFAVLGTAAVLGFTKAETERIYLFLVPALCVAAATALPERRLPAVVAALAVQALATELLFYTVW